MLMVFIRKIRSMCNVYTDCESIIYCGVILPIAVAVSSKAWVCGRLLAAVAGSNPAENMESLESVLCCQVEVSATG
jgi:hypothetical protein